MSYEIPRCKTQSVRAALMLQAIERQPVSLTIKIKVGVALVYSYITCFEINLVTAKYG